MKLMVGDVFTTVATKDQRVHGIVRSVCKARPSGYKHMPKYKSGRWDGYVSLTRKNSFPTGLLGFVVQALRDRGYQPEIGYMLAKRPIDSTQIDPSLLNGITLRDYQIEALQRLLEATRGVAKMATNSGKTEVMAALCKLIDGQTLILLHRQELMYQTARRFQDRLGCDVGLIGDGHFEPKRITIAMIQTLSQRIDDFQKHADSNAVLMVDECHHLSSSQMMDVLYRVPGWYRYGFSGTPLKHEDLSDLKLMAMTGRIVYEITNAELIERGYSAQPVVTMHVIEHKKKSDAYAEAYAEMIVSNEERNQIIAQIANEAEGVVLVLVERIAHGLKLQGMIEGATFVSGADSTETRQSVLKAMEEHKGVYIATQIFDEGVDVPSIDTVVLSGGGESPVRLLQRIGRGLRKKDGQNILHVHDFIDDTNKFLLRHTESRIDVYEAEGFDIRIEATARKTL